MPASASGLPGAVAMAGAAAGRAAGLAVEALRNSRLEAAGVALTTSPSALHGASAAPGVRLPCWFVMLPSALRALGPGTSLDEPANAFGS